MATEFLGRTPTASDIATLIADLRPADLAELQAAHGEQVDIGAVLREAIARSDLCQALELHGRFAGIFGYVPLPMNPRTGVPWLLGTTEIWRHPKAIHKAARHYIDAVRDRYDDLLNVVDARNTVSIRWLKRLGYTVHPDTVPVGPRYLPFHPFTMRLSHV